MRSGVPDVGRVEMEGSEMEDGGNRSGFALENWPHAKLPIAGEEERTPGNPKALKENFINH